MKLLKTNIPDVVIIEPTVFEDERGWFMERFNEKRFYDELKKLHLPIPASFVQDNHSYSKKGVLRGLHYQRRPFAQGKLVQVVQGSAFDVAVDIRPESNTYGKWVGVELNEYNKRMLWIPEGFAHGFLAIEDTHFLYKTTNYYNKNVEDGIRWDDPDLAIEWPTFPTSINRKDKAFIFFKELDSSQADIELPIKKQEKLDILAAKHTNFKNDINPKISSENIETDKCGESQRLQSTLSGQQKNSSELVHLIAIGDNRGSLVSLESKKNIPFDIQRIYYIFATQAGISRGFHAHRELKQLLICVAGSCQIHLDDGKNKQHVLLNDPTQGLYLNQMIWREMHDFSADCVLMVLANQHYNENDYIRNYDEFIRIINE